MTDLEQALTNAGYKWDPNLESWYRVAYTEGADHAQMECLRTPGMAFQIPLEQLQSPELGDEIKHTFDAMFVDPNAIRIDAERRYLRAVLDDIAAAITSGTPAVVTGKPTTLHAI